ncbi:GMC oxidoreductase [Sinorhizobium meliloti]|uniref:GMC oxidoreductase n=1 Tax=Rhizobium meliloti TaxID=382 RepID=UPI000B4A03B7|nr:GMC family oxidoreductase [Sinorhizobium meliloti]ASP95922.1 GMC family oxidoreductase [Sinorhizobium meliloti]MDW9476946.1 GMC family oxidoreductase [Sinorhizobium meliloti]MDW9843839.1 GMC family oxidoreductase [Sinorhizobium meliloti]MDX0234942.1 GMC family oxidoreductase [Sinorhizobium meliloti]MQX60816.1 GMC family oxidoreductase [Sinorhizobium meliloti]
MLFPVESALKADANTVAASADYDIVIVGTGISGAIIAKQAAEAGKRVLILEAGTGANRTLAGYNDLLTTFYLAAGKDNQSPFPLNANAAIPRSPQLRKLQAGETDSSTYIVQSGPYVSDTTYTRIFGGTTMHWEAKTPRMLRSDFKTRTIFGQGLDWPLSFEEIEDDYRLAEREIGVSANVEDQQYLGQTFPDGYVFPMRGLPLSYLDQQVNKGIEGTSVELYGETYPLKVRPYPQGRNSIPNPAYDGGKGYRPIGAVNTHQVEEGGRCQGNTNCVPLCTVQARYHSGKTLAKALAVNGERRTPLVELLPQAVASKVNIDPDSGKVRSLEVKVYKDPASPAYETFTVKGKVFVLAAGAIETARLMLASGLRSTSGLVGRNLMDHAYLLNWALMPQICGTMRGTSSTGGIVDLRDGPFRERQAAFAIDIHNDGWGWATGAPTSDLLELVDDRNLHGGDLRRGVIDRVSRQLLLAFMIEVMPVESNRIEVDPKYIDALGNMRPILSFTVPEYTMKGAAYARQFSRTVFARMGAQDHTHYDPSDFGYVAYDKQGYAIRGGNHLAGTHIMGTTKTNSVVDKNQRSWDHENLYLVGGGSMPTIGTANVTLTLAAMCFRSSRDILKSLH